MKKIIVVFYFSSLCFNLHAESVYTYNLKYDIPLTALSLGLFGISFMIDKEPSYIPDSFNKNNINALDRIFLFPPLGEGMMDLGNIAFHTMPFLPVITVFGIINYDELFTRDNFDTLLTYGLMYTQGYALTFGTRTTLKNTITRYRPYLYDDRIQSEFSEYDQNSFPSGSTSMTFYSAAFLSTTFSQEYPESKWKLPIIIGTYTLASIVPISKVTTGRHYFTDVLAGMAIGSFYGWAIPFFHKRQHKNDNVEISYLGNGLLVSLKL